MKEAPHGAHYGPESALHVVVCQQLRWILRQNNIDVHALMHPANGEKRSKAAAGKLKAMGTTAGYPDLMLFHPVEDGRFCGLAIELKIWPAKLRESQESIRALLVSARWVYVVCYGLQEAESALNQYLKRGM